MWESEYVVCPYYHRHENCKENIFQITCDGIESSASLVVKFSTAKARTNYTEEHCNDLKGCKECVVYQALNLKYGVLNEL
jgi:hypothetical protein